MKILILSGPNLNMLGQRDSNHYGVLTYKELQTKIKNNYKDIKFTFYQSNHEGKIIDYLHKKLKFDALIINAAGLTHTSVSLRDCLDLIKIPKVSVHLSNINNREDFRKIDLIEDVVDKVFMGKKEISYYDAIDYLLDK